MDELWQHHFKYYDLFQNNSNNYRKTIKFHLKELKNFKKILDTGAGSGNLTFEFLKQGKEITAIDSNEYSLKLLKDKCKNYKDKLKVLKMDTKKLDFGNSEFDGASSMFVIPFVNDNKKYFSEVYRVLKNSAKFTISSWAPISNSLQGLMNPLRKELKQKGLLPEYEKEWNYIQKSDRVHIKQVERGSNIKELKIILKNVGFKNIKELETPYGKYVYFLVCSK